MPARHNDACPQSPRAAHCVRIAAGPSAMSFREWRHTRPRMLTAAIRAQRSFFSRLPSMPDPKPPRKPATVDRFRALLNEVASGNGRVSRDLLDRIRAALARKRGGTGRKRTIDHDEVMRRHAAGQTGAQIAREMGVSRQAVSFIVGMYRRMSERAD